MERKVILIVGPTCSGKTSLSLSLAKMLNTEIISADSRQFYKHINIGTAKPSESELSIVKHHFINNLELDQYYNASKFEADVFKCFETMFAEEKIPIVVGGSGLYLKAIIDGIFDNVETDEKIRNQLKEKRDNLGNEEMYKELQKVDPKSAESMIPQYWKRVLRALEVYYSTGKEIWKWQEEHSRETDIKFFQFGLNWNREQLYKNIESRVDAMIENGLVDELKNILDQGFSRELNSLNTVGYRELFDYFDGNYSLDRAKELIKRNSRRYAKRQLTWFRKDSRINWFNIANSDEIDDIAIKICKIIS